MIIPPGGKVLSPETAQLLDDEFFGSDPQAYFRSRIGMLIDASEPGSSSGRPSLRERFLAATWQTESGDSLDVSQRDRLLQVAIDAFALRHHAAESAIRLYFGLAIAEGPSVWANIVGSPTRTVDLARKVRTHVNGTGHDRFWFYVLPADANEVPPEQLDRLTTALNVLGGWLHHALSLLDRDDIDINAAHNKVKHGLAVRTHNELLTMSQTPPRPDGSLPLEAVTGPGSMDIFDGPSLDYLSRPPKVDGHVQGLELTTLKLQPDLLLAESWMLVNLHGAMFALAADRHFRGRDVDLPTYPPLHLGPTPDELLRDVVVGMRQPVTDPPDGSESTRTVGLGLHEGFIPLKIDYGGARTGVITDV